MKTDTRYTLASGTQVREEDFGLLFYTMAGPRLYFLSSGDFIRCDFFQGRLTLDQWIEQHTGQDALETTSVPDLRKSLSRLSEKGIILEY